MGQKGVVLNKKRPKFISIVQDCKISLLFYFTSIIKMMLNIFIIAKKKKKKREL